MYETVRYNYILKVDPRKCEMLIRLSQYVIWICRKYGYFLNFGFPKIFSYNAALVCRKWHTA
jgi:hypothetical protein